LSSKILRHITRADFRPSYNLLLVWTSQCHASRIGIINKDTTVLTGLEHRSPEEPAHLFKHTRVYARIAPAQKIAIVKALQARGEVVAMNGDGMNDAPALNQANIGIALGQTGGPSDGHNLRTVPQSPLSYHALKPDQLVFCLLLSTIVFFAVEFEK
jgi:haloacid dehalogenase-like hydrolase